MNSSFLRFSRPVPDVFCFSPLTFHPCFLIWLQRLFRGFFFLFLPLFPLLSFSVIGRQQMGAISPRRHNNALSIITYICQGVKNFFLLFRYKCYTILECLGACSFRLLKYVLRIFFDPGRFLCHYPAKNRPQIRCADHRFRYTLC